MNPTPAPSLGRIVHFSCNVDVAAKINKSGGTRRYNVSDKVAAMITGLGDNHTCFLTLFPVGHETLIAISGIPYSSGAQQGTWSWPERTGEVPQEAAA